MHPTNGAASPPFNTSAALPAKKSPWTREWSPDATTNAWARRSATLLSSQPATGDLRTYGEAAANRC